MSNSLLRPIPSILQGAPRLNEPRRPVLAAPVGFEFAANALARCRADFASYLQIQPETDAAAVAELEAEWARGQEAQWAKVCEGLRRGQLVTFAFAPLVGFAVVPADTWFNMSSMEMPTEVRWPGTANPVPFMFRIGDLEWFLARRDRPIWTADQALMWLSTRDLPLVDAARMELGSERLTWPKFLKKMAGGPMLPMEAAAALMRDLAAGRLHGWAGERAIMPGFYSSKKWHRAAADDLSVWAFRTDRLLQAVVLDAAEVQALYPAEGVSAGISDGAPAAVSAEDAASRASQASDGCNEEAHPAVDPQTNKQKKDAWRARCRSEIRDWIARGHYADERPGTAFINATCRQFGFGKNFAASLFAEVTLEFPGPSWGAVGRKSHVQEQVTELSL